ncbi:MAG: oligosaccharide flippase family protein [Deltaproteobacteria bacterium]|nr:oligosaccharide flippase family protein [Deltaproteobacteria bacterium]
MANLRGNVIANFVGRFWEAIIGLAVIPFYIYFLGVENYGLIGFFLLLTKFFGVLDAGLSSTINRELARNSAAPQTPELANSTRDIVRTLEWIYWLVGGFIFFGVYFLADPLANFWLKPVNITFQETAQAIQLMGLTIAMQWPTALYTGGINGLQRQIPLNIILFISSTLTSVGVLLVLWIFPPTLLTFFIWRIAVGGLTTLALQITLWRFLPAGSRRPYFSWDNLKRVRKFTLGMSGIGLLSFILIQTDRIVLSKILPLDTFGGYTLAAMLASGLYTFVQPLFGALYPKFSQLVSVGDTPGLTALYHKSCQVMAVMVFPASLVIAFFSTYLLTLWTGRPDLAQFSGPILSVLVLGTALNGLMNLPYALQLAYGWTRLALWQNVVAICVTIPLTIFFSLRFGAIGASFSWLLLNLSYVLFSIPIMHKKLIPREKGAWYKQDVLIPLIPPLAVSSLGYYWLAPLPEGIFGVVLLTAISFLALVGSALAAQYPRQIMLAGLQFLRR